MESMTARSQGPFKQLDLPARLTARSDCYVLPLGYTLLPNPPLIVVHVDPA